MEDDGMPKIVLARQTFRNRAKNRSLLNGVRDVVMKDLGKIGTS